MITFTLSAPTKTLNELRKLHYRAYARYRQEIAFWVYACTLKQRPVQPYQRARIVIERHSSGQVDVDGLYGGLKPLLDVLQPFDAHSRPDSIGIIASDAPDHLQLEVRQVKSQRGKGKTVVEIYEVTE